MKRVNNRLFTIVPVETNYKCWRCPSRANWNIYLHGDPEPLGDYITKTCTNHLGTTLLANRYETDEATQEV